MNNGTGKMSTVLKALPLVILDVMSTFAAFIVGTWGMDLQVQIFGMNALGWHIALLAAINVAVLAAFRMYTSLWKYASINELLRLVLAVTVASVAGDLIGAVLFGERFWIRSYIFAWLFMLVACGASRFAIRIMAGAKGGSIFGVTEDSGLPRTLVIGAGENGSIVVKRMLADDTNMPGFPVGLVDDDQAKVGRHVHGVKVLGTCDDIPDLCEKLQVEQLVISIPNATRSQRGRIYDLCVKTGIRTMMVPFELDVAGPDAPAVLREVIENNAFGVLNLVKKTREYGCMHFVMIYTDKAVNPTIVMGATKRVDEMVTRYYAFISEMICTTVGFGNVLGSNGSAIPLFRRQIPLCILKLRLGILCGLRSAYALLVYEERTQTAAFVQDESFFAESLLESLEALDKLTPSIANRVKFFTDFFWREDMTLLMNSVYCESFDRSKCQGAVA